MNAFKKKPLYMAVVACLGAVGIADTANAVNINPNGTGQVLIYPYYTARNGTDTYLSVVNTTASAKAVKVRFTEGRNSREVLDFNLYMSPFDVFAGVITNDPVTGGAKFTLGNAAATQATGPDKSCTYPAIPAGGASFVNYGYAGANVAGIQDSNGDWETGSMDRTREGYFEIIEMGVITNTAIVAAITHNSSGTPANCALVQDAALVMSAAGASANIGGQSVIAGALAGGLAGTAALVNVANGTDYSYDPVALADFRSAASGEAWFAAGSIRPDMRSALPVVSRIFKGGTVVTTDWTGSSNIAGTGSPAVNAVSAVLMHNNLMNEYVLDVATTSATDFVITMPTKRYYVPAAAASAAVTASPFTKSFSLGGACEPVTVSYYDREEQFNTTPSTFSPPPPTGGPTSLCWESTVLTVTNTGGTNVLGSANGASYPVTYTGGSTKMQHGWINMAFAQTYSSLAAAGNSPAGIHTYTGLPTVGFAVQSAANGNVGGVMSNYGGSYNHKFTNSITAGGVVVTGE